jgi:hypothetical protein
MLLRRPPESALYQIIDADLGPHVLAADHAAEAIVQDLKQPGLEVGTQGEALPGYGGSWVTTV